MKEIGSESFRLYGKCGDYPLKCNSNKYCGNAKHECKEVYNCDEGNYVKKITLAVLTNKILFEDE